MRAWVIGATALAVVCASGRAQAEGLLVARDPEGAERGSFPLERTAIEGDVAGDVLSVSVSQRFRNTFSQRIEAVYVFPLPDTAAVDAMEMRIGSRVVRARIDRREAAQRTYAAARREGRHAALLEQERPNVFTFSVANIEPGATLEVRLHYFDRARYDHGVYETAIPTTVGPRYVPGTPRAAPPSGTGTHPDTDRVPDASRLSPAYTTRPGHALALTLHGDAGVALADVETPAHDTVITRPTAQRFSVTLRDKDEIPNRDVIVRWRPAVPELAATVFTHRVDTTRDGYFSLTLLPRAEVPDAAIAPRELVFLLDTSGSMQGAPLDTARSAVRRALDTLHRDDTFQIIDFADTASHLSPAPLANTPENLHRAWEYLDTLRASGGTNQLAGIHAALSTPVGAGRTRYVVFMTDGYIGNEREVIALTARERGDARLFSFGIGSSVNRYLLDEVAIAGRGAAEYLRPHEDPRALIDRFYARIGRPYLVDVSLEWSGDGVHDTTPAALPDVSALEPLVVHGRYRDAGPQTLRVRGRLAGRPWEQSVAVNLPAREPSHEALAPLWARAEIADLERAMHATSVPAEFVARITDLALEHHLVSQYTAFVAVDDAPATQPGDPLQVAQPATAPQGVDLRAAGVTSLQESQFDFSDETVNGALTRPTGAITGVTVNQPAPPPPSAPEPASGGEASPRVAQTETLAMRRHGGCVGCTVPTTAPRAPWALTGFAVVLWALRRRRR